MDLDTSPYLAANDHFDGFFSKAKKRLKSATSGVKGVARAVFAPITIGVTAPLTGAAWLGAKAGVKPLAKAHTALKGELQAQATVLGAHLAVGAVGGAAIAAAPAVTAALPSVSSATALEAASVASALVGGGAAAGVPGAGGETPAEVAASGAMTQAAGGGGNLIKLAAPAVAGFFIAGPIGAAAGLAAGAFLGRKKE